MKKSFITYYFLTYAACLIPMGTTVMTDDTFSWLKRISIIFLVPFAIALVLAPLFYWLLPKIKIRHQRKKIKKDPFDTFVRKNRFTAYDTFIHGTVQEYAVTLYADYDDFQHSKWISAEIIFNPKQGNQFIPQYIFDQLIQKYKGKNVTCHTNSLLIKKVYTLKMPKHRELYDSIHACIRDLQKHHIDPISYGKWKFMSSEAEEHFYKLANR